MIPLLHWLDAWGLLALAALHAALELGAFLFTSRTACGGEGLHGANTEVLR